MTMEARTARHEVFLKGETVCHPPEKKDPRKIDAGKIRYQRDASRADHQFVVGKGPAAAFPVGRQHEFPIRVDRRDAMVGTQLDAFFFDFIDGSMGQGLPVGNLAAQVKRKPADAEIGIPVRQDQGDLRIGRQFLGAKAGADSGIAAANDHQFIFYHDAPRRDERVKYPNRY